MPSWNQEEQGGKKTEYLGNHTYTTEAGHVVEFDNTPGDRRIHVYHASGTFIEIQDSGIMITKVEDQTQEFNNKGKDQKVTGDFNISVNGNVNMHVTGNLVHEVKGNYNIVTHGDFTVKSKGNHLVEAGGDQRVQINGKTSHRASGDRDEITGGNKTVTTNRDHYEGVGGEMQLNVSSDLSVGAGNDVAINAVRQLGLAALEDILSLAAGNQIQTAAKEGTIIKDNSCVQITSFGSNPSFIYNAGTGPAALVGKTGGITLLSGGNIGARIEGTYSARAKGTVTISSLAKNIIKSSGGTDIEATTVAATTGDTPDTTTPTITMPEWFT